MAGRGTVTGGPSSARASRASPGRDTDDGEAGELGIAKLSVPAGKSPAHDVAYKTDKVPKEQLAQHQEVREKLQAALKAWSPHALQEAMALANQQLLPSGGCQFPPNVMQECEKRLAWLSTKYDSMQTLLARCGGTLDIDFNAPCVVLPTVKFAGRKPPDASAGFAEPGSEEIILDAARVVKEYRQEYTVECCTAGTEPRAYQQELADNRARLVCETLQKRGGVPKPMAQPLGRPGGGASGVKIYPVARRARWEPQLSTQSDRPKSARQSRSPGVGFDSSVSPEKGKELEASAERWTRQGFARGVQQFSLNDLDTNSGPVREAGKALVDASYEGAARTICITTDPKGPGPAAVRSICEHVLRDLAPGGAHNQKVVDGLRLLEYLGGSEGLSHAVTFRTVGRLDPRIISLRVTASLLDAKLPPSQPSADLVHVLGPLDARKFKAVLDACTAVARVELPVHLHTGSTHALAVQGVADVLTVSSHRVLQEWARVQQQLPTSDKAQQLFALSLYQALFAWTVERLNCLWADMFWVVQHIPENSTPLTVSSFAHPGTDSFLGFTGFILNEALAQWVAGALPLDGDAPDAPPKSMRARAHELALLRGTPFADASSGLFGQAGLVHFLTTGFRSPAAILKFVELIRDGDLQMRGYFGACQAQQHDPLKARLRVRAGEVLQGFDCTDISKATLLDPFSEELFELGDDPHIPPEWHQRAPVEVCLESPLSPRRHWGKLFSECASGVGPHTGAKPLSERTAHKTRLLRAFANGLQVIHRVRGDLHFLHASTGDARRLDLGPPALIRLMDLWKEQVYHRDLEDVCDFLELSRSKARELVDRACPRGCEEQRDQEGPYYVLACGSMGILRQLLREECYLKGVDHRELPKWALAPKSEGLSKAWSAPSHWHADRAAYMDSIPQQQLRPTGIRDTGGLLALDSRNRQTFAPQERPSPEQGLLVRTSQMLCSNHVVDRANRTAKICKALRGDDLGDAIKQRQELEQRDQRSFWRDVGVRVNPAIVRRLDRVRAIYTGQKTRVDLAELQRQHIAAAKIQLSFLEHRRRQTSAALRIQGVWRAALVKGLLQGRKAAKDLLRTDDAYRGGVRVPDARAVTLVLPMESEARAASVLSDPRHKDAIQRKIQKAVAQHCGLSFDLVGAQDVQALEKGQGLQAKLEVPMCVKGLCEELQATLTRADSPMHQVYDYLQALPERELRRPYGRDDRQAPQPQRSSPDNRRSVAPSRSPTRTKQDPRRQSRASPTR